MNYQELNESSLANFEWIQCQNYVNKLYYNAKQNYQNFFSFRASPAKTLVKFHLFNWNSSTKFPKAFLRNINKQQVRGCTEVSVFNSSLPVHMSGSFDAILFLGEIFFQNVCDAFWQRVVGRLKVDFSSKINKFSGTIKLLKSL